jgi:hypothetical protein
MNVRQLRARIEALALAYDVPAPPTLPELDDADLPSDPIERKALAELETSLLSQVAPLGADAEEFLRLSRMLRDVAAVQVKAETDSQGIDVKAELLREAETP